MNDSQDSKKSTGGKQSEDRSAQSATGAGASNKIPTPNYIATYTGSFDFHDAGEAYVGDMVSPLKKSFPAFRAVEDEILALIYESAGLPVHDALADAEVKRADNDMLVAEAQELFDEEHYDQYFGHYFPALPADAPRVLPVRWDMAEGMWLSHWKRLSRPR
jgi:hypothetical protein